MVMLNLQVKIYSVQITGKSINYWNPPPPWHDLISMASIMEKPDTRFELV